MEKKPKIKNEHYLKFLRGDFIDLLTETDIQKAIHNAETYKSNRNYKGSEAAALLIIMYYTGARPIEVLRLKGKDITKEAQHLKLALTTAKKGTSRYVYLPLKKPLVKKFETYADRIYPDLPLFFHFRNSYTRLYRRKNGEVKTYIETTDKLRFWFKIWFDGVMTDPIPPYYLRHNRFSSLMMKGASPEEVRQFKGSKDLKSVMPYLHMSSAQAKKISRILE